MCKPCVKVRQYNFSEIALFLYWLMKPWFPAQSLSKRQRLPFVCKGHGKSEVPLSAGKMEKGGVKAAKTIWQIRYAPLRGTGLLIWEVGLLNPSLHYSNRNPKDICSLQCGSCRRARSCCSSGKKVGLYFPFFFKTQQCLERRAVRVAAGNFAAPRHRQIHL